MNSLLASTMGDGSWTPGIGDPTLIGWFTVAAYLGAALLCVRVSRSPSQLAGKTRNSSLADGRFWLCLAIVLGLLGVNKQLDLQTALTVWGRSLAIEQGWYEDRHVVQKAFILMVACFGFVGSAAVAWVCQGAWRRYRLASFGLILLVSFVVIRAASFHHIDLFLGMRAMGLRFNSILELSGIGCIAAAAARQVVGRSLDVEPERDVVVGTRY